VAKIQSMTTAGDPSPATSAQPQRQARHLTLTCASASSVSSTEDLYEAAGDAFDAGDYKLSDCIAEVGAARGNVRELTLLGIIYIFDKNPERDPVRGFHYLLDAAQKGEPFGQLHVAECFANGTGTEFDLGAEMYWTMQARQHPEIRDILDRNVAASRRRYERDKREEERDRPRKVDPGCIGPHCVYKQPD
jgi:TPR repeat protein